jgi:hypothetical protein
MNESSDSSKDLSTVARRVTGALCTTYFIAIVAVWATLHFAADQTRLGTVVLFGQAWMYALPLAPLVIMLLI